MIARSSAVRRLAGEIAPEGVIRGLNRLRLRVVHIRDGPEQAGRHEQDHEEQNGREDDEEQGDRRFFVAQRFMLPIRIEAITTVWTQTSSNSRPDQVAVPAREDLAEHHDEAEDRKEQRIDAEGHGEREVIAAHAPRRPESPGTGRVPGSAASRSATASECPA